MLDEISGWWLIHLNSEQGQSQSLGRLLTAVSSCVFTISKVGGCPASLRSLLQHFTISWWFVLSPHICSKFPLLQLMTVAVSPSLVSLWVGLGSVFVMGSRYLKTETRFPSLIFVFSWLKKSRSLPMPNALLQPIEHFSGLLASF